MQLKFLVFIFLLLSPTVWAIERVALVLGNGAYKEVDPLANPVNDAKDMAKALRSLDFKVIEKHNLNRKQMAKAITQFGKKLGKGTVGLFYYAGHGLQVNGHNYLLPLEAPIETIDEVQFESIDVDRILAKMEAAGNGLNIMILDACRNNPFRGRGGFRAISRGLARVNAPTGSLIIYATAPGKTAADGKGKNGLFTKYLLKNMLRPNLDVALMLRDTRYQVMQESERLGFKQVPWESSSLLTPFCFAGCEQGVKPTAVAAKSEPVPVTPTKEPSRQSFEPEMISVPAGTFNMGCISGKNCRNNEKPVHKVSLAAFKLAKTEVTFDQWDACVAAKGCSHQPNDEGWGRGQRPVINVNWNDVQQYLQWLHKVTGKSYRLPTEAEWEYAARAGTATQYSWGNKKPSYSKKAKNGASHNGGEKSDCYLQPNGKSCGTEVVASYAANPWGFYDIHGNVGEWTCSVYKKTYNGAEKRCVKSEDARRVVRGGSWFDYGWDVRSAYRAHRAPDFRGNRTGFRLSLGQLSSSQQE